MTIDKTQKEIILQIIIRALFLLVLLKFKKCFNMAIRFEIEITNFKTSPIIKFTNS